MTRKRFFGVFFGIVGAVLLALVLYVAFGDLGRHKARIEAFVTQSIGRPFAIDGPFKLRLFPVIDVSAERVRLGNAPGGSQPQMIEIGKAVVQIGFWSLISGPPDVRLFELNDATVLLEHGCRWQGQLGHGSHRTKRRTKWRNRRGRRRGRGPGGHPQRALEQCARHLSRSEEARSRGPARQAEHYAGPEELLALEGQGKLDVYPLSLKGEVGPLKSLLTARDMRIAMQGTLGKLALDINGVVGSLDPLDGADLTLKVEHPDLEDMLKKLELPVIATGPMQIDGRLKDAGALHAAGLQREGRRFHGQSSRARSRR